jgi:hypothetical protein
MNEFIEVRFQKDGRRLRIKRQLPGGIAFDEPDAIERTVGIGFDARTEGTRERMNSIRRLQGWDPGTFKLNVSVEDGSLMLRGVNQHALPEGFYRLRFEIEEAATAGGFQTVEVKQDSGAVVKVDVRMDDRTIDVDLARCDPAIEAILERSMLDGFSAIDWVRDDDLRPSRRACLLNLLASLRSRPTLTTPLAGMIHEVFVAANDRIYAKTDRALVDQLNALAADPKKPFYAEGKPHAPIHGRLLSAIPESIDVRARFKDLFSFRGEGKPSMQVVAAVSPADLPHTYVEFDLDLGNPLQDVLGFIVHMGELLSGKPTNHLDMRRRLGKTKAAPFLCYKVGAA